MGSATMQGQLWGAAAHDWAELQEPTAAPLWEAMLDAATVGLNTHLLDAGCGAGGASVLAARRGAQTNGLDASVALLAIARQRVPDGDFRLGDLEALPYADGTFDAIIAADVLAYVANPFVAVREMRRVSTPAGRVVVATCDSSTQCQQHALVASVCKLLRVDVCGVCSPYRDTFSAAGALETLLARAGLAVIDGGAVACPCEYPDQETAWQAQVAAGPLRAAQRIVGAAQLKAALLRALAPYTTTMGSVSVVSQFHYVVSIPDDGRLSMDGTAGRGKGGGEM